MKHKLAVQETAARNLNFSAQVEAISSPDIRRAALAAEAQGALAKVEHRRLHGLIFADGHVKQRLCC